MVRSCDCRKCSRLAELRYDGMRPVAGRSMCVSAGLCAGCAARAVWDRRRDARTPWRPVTLGDVVWVRSLAAADAVFGPRCGKGRSFLSQHQGWADLGEHLL